MAPRAGSFVSQVRALVRKNFLTSVLRRPIGFFLSVYGLPIALLAVLASIPTFVADHNKYGVSSPKPLSELSDILDKKLVIVKPSRLGPDVDRVTKAITEPLDDDLVQVVEDEGMLVDICLANLRGISPCFASITFSDSPETKGSFFSEAYDDSDSWWSVSEDESGPEKFKTKHVWEYIIRVDPARSDTKFDVPEHKTDTERTVMPVQVAVNRAITNSTANPETMAFTDWTQAEEDQSQRESTVTLVGTILSFALFACYFLIIYRHTTLITSEREAGMSQLVDAMGGGSAVFARVLSWLLIFGASTIPVYIIFGVLYSKLLFPSTDLGLIVGWQILEGLAVNSSTIFAASFFKKSRVSAIYVIGAFFLLSIGTQVFGFTTKPKPQPPGAYVLTLLFASANNVLFTQQMCLWEFNGKAADINVQPKPELGINTYTYKLTQAEMLGFLAVQIVIYPILAIVVEKYMHGIDYRHRTFNGSSSSEAHGTVIAETFNYEKHFVPNILERIFCCGKRKTVKAVNGVSLQSHKGQILGLVGPNGSGKTTTLQMMSGFISPSSGSVAFNASPAQIGICPQHNTFWDELTVMEHMKIWSRIKATNMTNVELDQMLVACDLELKRNSKAKTLSGGQKRKLQLACMFVGDSSLCLIDECTSGLDPLSRRAIWEILLAQRAKRSIIFTTHFLDEVDVLADQIIILTKGKVKCHGPAAELKNLHGGGYKVLVPQAAARTQTIEYPATDHQDQVVYTTPDSSSAATLCARLSAAGIVDYSVSGPQVEDVFLSVADDDLILKPQMPSEPLDDNELDSAQTTSFGQQVWALFRKRVIVLKRFWWPYFYVLLLPLLITPFLKNVIGEYRQPSCANLTPDLYEASPTTFFWDEYCETENYCEHMTFGPKSANKELRDAIKQDLYEFRDVGGENATKLIKTQDTYDGFVEAVKEKKDMLYSIGGVYLGSRDQAPVVAFKSGWGSGQGFMMMNMLAQIQGDMPILARLGGFAQTRKNADDLGTLYVVFFTLLQALYPAAFVLYPAIERGRRVRSLEYSNGVRRGPLWVAYGLFDAMFVLVIAVGTTAIMSVNLAKYWNGPIFIMLPVLFLYGLAALLMGYLISHFVNGPLKSFLAMAMISLIMFAISAISFSIGFGYSENGDSVSNGLTFGLNLIFPIGNVWRAVVLGFNVLQVACKDGHLLPTSSIYAYGGPILYLVIQVIILLLLIIWLEGDMALFRRTTLNSVRVVDGEKADGVRSDEVKGEAARVEETESDLLRAIRVDKSFGSNHAVDRVSFGLPQSDVLALIGPNGAGKSTLVNMITSELSCDGGQIFLNGEDARTRGAQRYLGVCPQHDALDMMSTRDHLSFYARIKGIKNVKRNVDHVMKRLDLTPHANTLATKLSGGNKRKLSLAIALIGKPPVLVLDEPTSAMDAVAKRSFWKIIQEIAPGRSVLLTTHSMEEADTLATRTAIISRKLLAVGTTQALREKYNNVYYVSVLLKSAPNSSVEEMEQLRVWIQNKIPNSKLEREVMGGQIRFTIPGSDRNEKNTVTDVIQMLEREKDNVGIEYYSIGGATLERVFLNVVRENNVNEEDGKLGRGERLTRFLRLRR